MNTNEAYRLIGVANVLALRAEPLDGVLAGRYYDSVRNYVKVLYAINVEDGNNLNWALPTHWRQINLGGR